MIKEVTEIPKPDCSPKGDTPKGKYAELIREDLKNAFNQKISKFELIGYDAKPDYLVQVARTQTYDICKELVYDPARKYAFNKLKQEYLKDVIKTYIPTRYAYNHIIKVHGITLKDGIKHIFVEINFDIVKNYKKECLALSRDKTEAYTRRKKNK